jgi:exonuclease III
MNQFELEAIQTDGYTLAASYCRSSLKNGVICIFVDQNLRFSNVDLNKFSTEQDIEACKILLTNSILNIYIATIYRAPSSNFTYFMVKLECILNLLHKNSCTLILCGDLNVILLTI